MMDDESDHVSMAIDQITSGTIGCCYYIASQEVLFCMNDIEGDEDVVENLKMDIQPTILIQSPRFEMSPIVTPYRVVIRPSNEFKFDFGLKKLISIQERSVQFLVPGDDIEWNEEVGLTNTGPYLQLLSQIGMENKISIGCAGALITEIQKQGMKIQRIETFSLKDTMSLSVNTLTSLQIFGSTPSVFELFSRFAKTTLGRSRLRQMFLRPSLDLGVIQERQRFVSILVRNYSLTQNLSKSLSKIKNMTPIMINLQKGNIREWVGILEFCYHTIDIAEIMSELNLEGPNATELEHVGKIIHDTIDLEESMEQNRTVIKRNINPDLDKVKDVYNGMETILSNVAKDIGWPVVFIPQLGYHVCVPVGVSTEWETRFVTDKHAYMKNDQTRQMDNEIGDLWGVICDTEIEMAHNLAQQVLQHSEMLIDVSNQCGRLDSLLTYAHAAVEYRLVCPTMTTENMIDIKGGRHLLLRDCIPNDTFLVGGDMTGPTMIMMTGPNYSGKSVYQKQVALICFLSQIGSFVPADTATIGIIDKILTRINTGETVSHPQSAFMIDLQQISKAIKSSTNRSLVVIDEFGKGTCEYDGAGLASAVFQHFLSRGQKVLINTHFHEILDSFPTDRVQFSTMEVIGDPLTYLYRMSPGICLRSYGIECAEKNGIPLSVVTRAQQLIEMKIKGEDLVEACSRLPTNEIEELEEAEEIARRFLSQDLDVVEIGDVFGGYSKVHSQVEATKEHVGGVEASSE